MNSEGGFINPAASVGALPQVVVDTDGRIFQPAPAADGSQPLMPPIEVRDAGPGGAAAIMAAIMAAIRAAGLDTERSGGVAADTGSTIFTVVIDGQTIVSRFASGMSAVPGAAAFALLARLLDPGETWGAATPPAAGPFAPDAYLVYVAPTGAATAATADLAAWPLATEPGVFGTPALPDHGVAGLRSGLVTGADARMLAAGLAAVPAGSLVASGGTVWSAWVRPVFPDEIGG